MADGIVDRAVAVVVERDALGWHRSIDARGPGLDDVDALAETASAARIWDRVSLEAAAVDGMRARATRLARIVADDRHEVRHRATTTSIAARVHAADGTFVVVRRSLAHDVGAFARERDLDAEVAAFVDDVAFVRAGSASTSIGTVLLSAAAAGTVLHEAVGHLHEADNVARFGAVTDAELPTGLAVVDLGETPGSDHPRLDDRLQPMRAATLLDDEGRRGWLGVDERPHDAPPHVARARRAHGGRIDLDLTTLRAGLRGFVGPAATELAMCDKQGQRLPVATTCPALVLAGVTVRDLVV